MNIFNIFSLIVLLFSAVIHELSHGFVANRLGDPTARYMGRLTLNPLKHIDMFGTIILPLILFISRAPFIFGYAKPIVINPYNLKNQKRDMAIVGLSGPLSNIGIALLFSIILQVLPVDSGLGVVGIFFAIIVQINITLAVFNLIPIPPFDGSRLVMFFLPITGQRFYNRLESQPILSLMIGVFIFYYLISPLIMNPLMSVGLGSWYPVFFQ